jgi:hypothetical protein
LLLFNLSFFFSAVRDRKKYELGLELSQPIVPTESKTDVTARIIDIVMKKASEGNWDTLAKDPKWKKLAKVDWDRFEGEEEPTPGFV